MSGLGAAEIIILIIILILIYRFFKRKSGNQQELPSTIIVQKSAEEIINIPDNCPHCKNPNTKKIRLCEWCGNQII